MTMVYSSNDLPAPPSPLAVQILSMIFFTAFAIVATTLAFVWAWPVGAALAALVIWRGFGPISSLGQNAARNRQVARTRPAMPDRPSGQNAAFSAYRTDMLDRLEREQEAFDGFLTRLRAAKDKAEFDAFLDARASKAVPQPGAAAEILAD